MDIGATITVMWESPNLTSTAITCQIHNTLDIYDCLKHILSQDKRFL